MIVGTHYILEMYDCDRLIDTEAFARLAIKEAAERGFTEVINIISHTFSPYGVTTLCLIAESHISIHTWPEHDYVACDVFTCGDKANARKACESLIGSFRPERHSMMRISRGIETETHY